MTRFNVICCDPPWQLDQRQENPSFRGYGYGMSAYNPDVETALTPARWTNEILAIACDVTGVPLKSLRDETARIDPTLTERWYASNETDYSLYDTQDYVVSMLHCWRHGGTSYASSNVTRLFMRWLAHRGLKPASFIDYHGGLGLTSAQLSMGHPEARVMFHTAVKHHADVGREVFKRMDLKVEIIEQLEPAEVLIAQETMEHFPDPCSEIRKIIGEVKPKWYLDQSSFTIDACGHFKHNHKVGKQFNAVLRELGYETYWKAEGISSPFNAKPAVWVKQ